MLHWSYKVQNILRLLYIGFFIISLFWVASLFAPEKVYAGEHFPCDVYWPDSSSNQPKQIQTGSSISITINNTYNDSRWFYFVEVSGPDGLKRTFQKATDGKFTITIQLPGTLFPKPGDYTITAFETKDVGGLDGKSCKGALSAKASGNVVSPQVLDPDGCTADSAKGTQSRNSSVVVNEVIRVVIGGQWLSGNTYVLKANDNEIGRQSVSSEFQGGFTNPGSYLLTIWHEKNATLYQCSGRLTITVQDTQGAGNKISPEPTEPSPPSLPCAKSLDKNGACPSIATGLGINISTDPAGFIKSIFSLVLGLSGGLALLLIIYSGYQLIESRGNPEKLEAARQQLISAIIGLVFIIFSLVILEIIGVDILKIPGFGG